MILSNRKLKLIITTLLLSIFLYFISIFDVNAATYYSPSSYWNDNQQCSGGVTCQNQINIPSSGSKSTLFAAIYDPNSIPVGTYGGYLNLWVSENPMSGFYFSNITASIKLGNDTTIECSSTSTSCKLTTETITESATYSTLHVLLTFSFYNSGNMQIYIGQKATARGNANSGHTYTWRMNSQVEKVSDTDTIGVNQFNSVMSDVNKNLNDVNSSLNNSDVNTPNNYNDFTNKVNGSMSNTPVSGLLTLPITFLRSVNNAILGSCHTVEYITLYDHTINLPCPNLAERLGFVWQVIDTILSCMLIFSIGKSLVTTFARLSDMDTNIMYEAYANGTKHRGESFDD